MQLFLPGKLELGEREVSSGTIWVDVQRHESVVCLKGIGTRYICCLLLYTKLRTRYMLLFFGPPLAIQKMQSQRD